MSTPKGTICFTTDGSDPRLPGGTTSPSAVEFAQALNIAEDTTIKSRVDHEGEWSALNEARFIVAPPRPGDASMDGVLNQLDIVQVLQAGKYRTGEPATFAEGDWNDDGVFDQLDIVIALATGNYLEGPIATFSQAAGVDELLALGGMSAVPFR